MRHASNNAEVRRLIARACWRVSIALAIAGAHLAFGTLWLMGPIELHAQSGGVTPMYAEFIADEPPRETILRREPLEFVEPIEIAMPELPEVAVAAIVEEPAVEAPRIDPLFGPDVTPYSARANLAAGKTATVLLTVSIGADGAVISAEIVRGSGDESVNAAALDYARATRWIPGTIGGVPRPMQASLTVILGENA
jgi:TonB family protein